MLVGITKSGFWARRILNISNGYSTAFRDATFLACPSTWSNTSIPRLIFFFIPSWKSKVTKVIDTIVRWVVCSQLDIAILCRIKYLEVR